MNIVIEVIAVNVTIATNTKGGTYRKLEVAYKDDKGEFKGKKLTDFSVKQNVEMLVNATPGTKLSISTVKNGEFRNWEGIFPYGQAPAAAPQQHTFSAPPTPPAASTPTKSTGGSTYETKEERAARQVMIVRQSSIASSINLCKTDKIKPSVEEVLKVAKAFEDFVMGVEPPKAGFDDFTDDVPE